MPAIDLKDISIVARRLKLLGMRYVLVGGGSLRFVVDARYRATARPTMDVDFAVEVDSRIAYSKLEARVRDLGFKHDMRPGAPKCRWQFEGIDVDILPTSPDAAEFGSPWFEMALDLSTSHEIEEGISVAVINSSCLMATKLDAFFDRGKEDYYGSEDLEDIIALLEGCTELLTELKSVPEALRNRIANGMRRLLSAPAFLETIQGHLSPESPPKTRARVLDTAKQIVELRASTALFSEHADEQ